MAGHTGYGRRPYRMAVGHSSGGFKFSISYKQLAIYPDSLFGAQILRRKDRQDEIDRHAPCNGGDSSYVDKLNQKGRRCFLNPYVSRFSCGICFYWR